MNAYEFAMQMELDGKKYFESLAEEASLPELRQVYRMLAADEQEHYNALKALRDGAGEPLPMSSSLATARSVFRQLMESETRTNHTDSLDGYLHGMKLELEGIRMYERLAADAEDEVSRKVLLDMAEEEHLHHQILLNIYRAVSSPAEYLTWEDDAPEGA